MNSKFLSPPFFPNDEDKTSRAASLQQIILVIFILSLAVVPIIIINPTLRPVLINATLLTASVSVLSLLLNQRGQVTIASYLVVLVVMVAVVYIDYSGRGIARPALIFSVIPIFISGLLLGKRTTFATALLLGISHSILAYMDWRNLFPFPPTEIPVQQNIIVPLLGYLTTAALLQLAIGRVQALLKRAKANEQAARNMSEMLEETQIQLQDYINLVEENAHELQRQSEALTQKTKELEQANQINHRRALQLQAVTEIARAIAEIRTEKEILPSIAQTVSKKMGYYHTGIFLVDESKQYAVLVASNSEGGQRMLQRGHRLEIGKVGIVGNAIATKLPRVALDVGEDTVFFQNPDLPDTRSEIALPLIAEGQVIGALDVQSTLPNAFEQGDIEILSVLAAQISVAIQNARLFEATQKSLADAQSAYRQFAQQEWAKLSKRKKITGFRFDTIQTTQTESIDSETIEKIAAQKVYIESNDQLSTLAIPITLRGEAIGILDIQASKDKRWTEDEIDIAQAVADRVAIATENARLFEETTERAERERKVSEITSKIRSTNDPNEMIQIALDELKQTLTIKDARILPYKPAQQEKG